MALIAVTIMLGEIRLCIHLYYHCSRNLNFSYTRPLYGYFYFLDVSTHGSWYSISYAKQQPQKNNI